MRFKLAFGKILNSYQSVYLDYSLRLLGQFFIFSLLIKVALTEKFADYAYFLMVSSYIAVVINASLDSLINNEFAKDVVIAAKFYVQTLKFKLLCYIIFSYVVITILNIKMSIFSPYWLLALVGIVLEHLDIKMRFINNYSAIKYRIFYYPLFLILKLLLAYQAQILGLLYLSILETLLIIVISLRFVKLDLFWGGEYQFLKENILKIVNMIISGLLIFSFLQLDQFLVYHFFDKATYAGYVLVYRFYAIGSALLGIYSRYIIPKVYAKNLKFTTALLRLNVINFAISCLVFLGFSSYIIIWLPHYSQYMGVIPIILIASIGLIFGQIRGIYFVQQQDLIPDVCNALIGITVFLSCFFYIAPVNVWQVSLCYLIGVISSGIMTTPIYKTGRQFLTLLKQEKIHG